MSIQFLKPKGTDTTKVELELSNRLVKLLNLYARYCNRSESEVVEHYLEEIFKEDTDFINWGYNRRYNKTFIKFIEEIKENDTDKIPFLNSNEEERM